MMTKHEFAEQAYEAAKASAELSGMPPLVTVAQAALESNFGASGLSQEAHNYFGIKAYDGHAQLAMATHECEHGKLVAVEAEFARYASMAECFAARDRILLHGACYAAARAARGDPEKFIAEMARHWATDPHYAAKLTAMLAEVKELLQ
jgi:flagellum-specific peptidoglycan hydrolase FlgJ